MAQQYAKVVPRDRSTEAIRRTSGLNLLQQGLSVAEVGAKVRAEFGMGLSRNWLRKQKAALARKSGATSYAARCELAKTLLKAGNTHEEIQRVLKKKLGFGIGGGTLLKLRKELGLPHGKYWQKPKTAVQLYTESLDTLEEPTPPVVKGKAESNLEVFVSVLRKVKTLSLEERRMARRILEVMETP